MAQSTSLSGVNPLPPRVVSIFHGIFKAPDEDGLFVTVPTTYALYTSDTIPSNDIGRSGDWYFYSTDSAFRTYEKIAGAWTLRFNSTGGSGSYPTDISDVNITSSNLSGCTITTSSWSGGTITGATISGGTISGVTMSSTTLTSPTINNGTLNNVTINNPTVSGGTLTGTQITGLLAPVNPSDAARKIDVDNAIGGVAVHTPCRVSTSANVTLAGGAPSTLDGVTLVANDRILVKNQTDDRQNGIYVVTTLGTGSNGTWTRATDGDANGELDHAYVLVSEGTARGGNSYVCTSVVPVVIGTSSVTWTEYYSLTSVPAGKITGTITASQIGSINAGVIIGSITSGQIGSVNASAIIGSITASQISSVNAAQIIGSITASQIGSVNASSITGAISAGQINTITSSQITGAITAGQIGSVSASTITGVIVTSQLTDQILNTLRVVSSDISVVKRVSSLPSLPSTNYPDGALVLNVTNKTLYQNVSGTWTVVTASSNVVGTLTSTDIASVNANSIVGLIIASQIQSVNASQIAGTITASQIGSVNATSITGSITSSQISSVAASTITGSIVASQISTVNASAIQGSITSSQISSVNASSITGSITASQISQVNATTITIGSLDAIEYRIGTGGNRTQITGAGIQVGNYLTINGDSNQNTLLISGTFAATLTGGTAAASLSLGTGTRLNDAGELRLAGVDAWYSFSGEVVSDQTVKVDTLKVDQNIRMATSDGWTVPHWTGSNFISWQWSGSNLKVRIDSTELTVATS